MAGLQLVRCPRCGTRLGRLAPGQAATVPCGRCAEYVAVDATLRAVVVDDHPARERLGAALARRRERTR